MDTMLCLAASQIIGTTFGFVRYCEPQELCFLNNQLPLTTKIRCPRNGQGPSCHPLCIHNQIYIPPINNWCLYQIGTHFGSLGD